ncbi:aminotransferase class I/II-fold pyridoxal phosphate-dependent enzyme [Pseudobacteroides cellulosolvens]|uniref:Arginine decarboxylase n=1 Tax=Pseudobacteroides cellulosolvens ATCC 35603 = DSM 2933 TaxID=398512 RepID=A0A0L6JMX4_9FIRM|nr:aminotransferase class I/II-fold pyridoxal phosphate-dependent enzyme [Pseudobacteroides cellulosolvens]KNY27166.1 Arginine decarboxylase [Pseudobacteroides cellulosolvens ATCC 35603 = DSM 2933]
MEYKTPVLEEIERYISSNPLPFHMPGHKMGKGFKKGYFDRIAAMDLTEIPRLDNLHYPDGVIKEAQDLAARAFGAEHTFFLVNGSTCGIHAIIKSICKPGEKLLVGRDCHKSVINGMMLWGVEPYYINPDFDVGFGIPTVISPQKVREAFEKNHDCKGILLTRPNYYGICSDLESIASIASSYGKILAVDEAHGAHLKFNNALPKCAMELGADVCIQSAHKTLPAFTQGSYLHVKSGKIDVERLKSILGMLQTTSPSYVVMSSLDYSRALMENEGEDLLESLIKNIDWFINSLKAINEFSVLSVNSMGNFLTDRTRLVINVNRIGLTGFEVERILRFDYNIQVEMSDPGNIVCIATVSDAREDFERLFLALADIRTRVVKEEKTADINLYKYNCSMGVPEQVVSLGDAFNSRSKKVQLQYAAGMIAKGTITPYPPGIPVVCPGERISKDIVDSLSALLKQGGNVNGIGKHDEIEVIDYL